MPNFAIRNRRQTLSIGAAPAPLRALSAEVGRRRRDGRLSHWRVRHCARPQAPAEIRRRQFLSDHLNSRYLQLRARSAAYAGPVLAAETTQKTGDDALPGRLAVNLLISFETAKEKVWKSLEKAWKRFGISLEKFGNPWKSLALRRRARLP